MRDPGPGVASETSVLAQPARMAGQVTAVAGGAVVGFNHEAEPGSAQKAGCRQIGRPDAQGQDAADVLGAGWCQRWFAADGCSPGPVQPKAISLSTFNKTAVFPVKCLRLTNSRSRPEARRRATYAEVEGGVRERRQPTSGRRWSVLSLRVALRRAPLPVSRPPKESFLGRCRCSPDAPYFRAPQQDR